MRWLLRMAWLGVRVLALLVVMWLWLWVLADKEPTPKSAKVTLGVVTAVVLLSLLDWRRRKPLSCDVCGGVIERKYYVVRGEGRDAPREVLCPQATRWRCATAATPPSPNAGPARAVNKAFSGLGICGHIFGLW